MKKLAFVLIVLAVSAAPGWAAVTITMSDGKISIDAENATVRQILTEWARLGQTRIVNLERLPSMPISLKLENVSEKVALDIVLRGVPGYMAAPREPYLAGVSVYDRILIMATTTPAPAVAQRPQPPAFPGAGFNGQPNVTQLRPQPIAPGAMPDPDADNEAEQRDDQALANAAAAGLFPSPMQPGAMPPGLVMPGNLPAMMMPLGTMGAQQPPQTTTPVAATPANPWNVPGATALPSLAPPPPPAQTPNQPLIRPRPPQADQ
jgi:hypothetical protein